MKKCVTSPSQPQLNSPSSKGYSTKLLLEISQAPGPTLSKKSCMQKIKKSSSGKNVSVNAAISDYYLKIRDLVWVILSWWQQYVAYCSGSVDIVGEKKGLDHKEIPQWEPRSVQMPPSPGQLCISLGWKECQSPAAHPAPPHRCLLVPKARRTHSCQEFMKQADMYTGLKIWPAVMEILGSLHNREFSLFPFPQLLVMFLI